MFCSCICGVSEKWGCPRTIASTLHVTPPCARVMLVPPSETPCFPPPYRDRHWATLLEFFFLTLLACATILASCGCHQELGSDLHTPFLNAQYAVILPTPPCVHRI